MRVAVLGGEARDLVNFRGHLISEMARAGHTVFGIAPGGTEEIRLELERRGATFVPISMDRTGLNPFADLASLDRLRKLFCRLRLDVLLAYEVKAVIFGILAARLAGVPARFAMITGRGSTLQLEPGTMRALLLGRLVKGLYRQALQRTSGVLFQNSDDLSFFAAEGMLPAHIPTKVVNGSGVDLDHFPLTPLPTGPVTFLFVGRLLKDKGIHEFLEASRRLKKSQVQARFQIAGPLDSNPNGLRSRDLAEWAQEGVVEYLGWLKDVRPAIAAADVMVLPSYSEGTPRSLLEAMAMGRAIVTTDAPGCRETVEDGVNGYLVAVKDVTALSEAMAKLARGRETIQTFGNEGRRIAELKYDVRLVTTEVLDFLGLAARPA